LLLPNPDLPLFSLPNMPLIFNGLTLVLDVFEIIYKYLSGRSEAAQDVNESEEHMLDLSKENFKELVESKVAEVEEENQWSTGDPGEAGATSTQLQPGAHNSSTPSNIRFDVLIGEVPTRTIEPFTSGALRAYQSASDLLKSTRSFGRSSSWRKGSSLNKDDQSQDPVGDAAFHQNSFSNPGFEMNANPMAELISAADPGPKEAVVL
jgi:hypothetical protein